MDFALLCCMAEIERLKARVVAALVGGGKKKEGAAGMLKVTGGGD